MADSEGSFPSSPVLDKLDSHDYSSVGKGYGTYGIVGAAAVAILIPILLSTIFMGKKKVKQRGVPVEVGGEAGYAVRNARHAELVEVPWKGATTMAALFEQSCRKHSPERFLGTRKLISKEFVTASDGRKFEKLHLGDYEWQTYGQVFDRVCNFASGLIMLGHNEDARAAIFADTRAEWLIAFQVSSCLQCLYVSFSFYP
jgi:long-chain acyl-CoA synthetase